jgi:hypothetical protein
MRKDRDRIGTLIFPSYGQAASYLKCTYTEIVAKQHHIVKATIGEHPVGWVLQLQGKKK